MESKDFMICRVCRQSGSLTRWRSSRTASFSPHTDSLPACNRTFLGDKRDKHDDDDGNDDDNDYDYDDDDDDDGDDDDDDYDNYDDDDDDD